MDLYSVVDHVSLRHGNNSTSGWRDFADGDEPYMVTNYKQNREESMTHVEIGIICVDYANFPQPESPAVSSLAFRL